MAIKIDFEKAYDRLNWHFLEKCCLEYGMSEKTISIIMQCVSSVSFKILWNNEKLDMFKPNRGLRQGDPLSPYLFVIAMDKLSQLIEKTVIKEKWIPMKAGQRGPQISHVLFVDDLLLFAEATENQMKVALETLDKFGAASGFKINAEKDIHSII
ncbi:secreted RxLR effector protein 78-like [Arachis hypogaea]|uniref:secreted RxLR effector protein 78-like n=1 Tax=Arachis hypogaea TaxID=3818 RepID=UPI003B210B7F